MSDQTRLIDLSGLDERVLMGMLVGLDRLSAMDKAGEIVYDDSFNLAYDELIEALAEKSAHRFCNIHYRVLESPDFCADCDKEDA